MKLLRNSLYSLLGTGLPTLVSIATIPLFISTIGPERYGILAIAWLVLGYFGAADFGIGRAITQRISAMQGKGAKEGRAAMASSVWSALVSMLGFGIIGATLVFVSATWYFGGPFKVGEGLRGEILASLWILAFCNPVMAVNGVLSGALIGLERFRLVSCANVISNSALLLFPLATSWFFTIDIGWLILASLTARVLGLVILGAGVWQAILRGQPLAFSGGEFRRLANFGAWIMVTALVGPFMVYADRLVIGALQDAAAVAAYTIPFQIASRTQILPQAAIQALFPRFAADERDVSQARCRDYTAFVGQLFVPVITSLICLAAPLLNLWLGEALDARSVMVAQLVLAGFWINAVANVPYALIQAQGNPRFTGLLHLAELPFYFALLFVLGTRFGLPGYAAAFALRCGLDCLMLARKAGAADRFVASRLAAPAALVLGSLLVCAAVTDWRYLIAAAAVFGALGVLAGLLGMPPTIRARLAQLPMLRGRAGILVRQQMRD